jgi:hypothetical protein
LKPAWEDSSQDLISKIPITNIGLMEWFKMQTLSSNPSSTKTKTKLLPYTVDSWYWWVHRSKEMAVEEKPQILRMQSSVS